MVTIQKNIMSESLFIKKGVKSVRMKINPYDYKLSAREAAIKYAEVSLSAN
jgi:hypothetical protein